MCGIVGAFSRSIQTNIDLSPALRQLHHRGPDHQGEWHNSHIHLGHARLSIIDLSSAAHQPMSYQGQRFWLSFNGEIYNYLELRQQLLSAGYAFDTQSDTEVLLAAYACWGEDCVKKLRGMFAFAIWDQEEQCLFLARDRVGEKPLYYWRDEETLYFASELNALLTLLPKKPELAPESIDAFLHYQYVPEPATLLQGVQKLPAAHVLRLERKRWQMRIRAYWSLEHIPALEGKPEELIRQELDRSIELTLRSDVPVGIALSGGLDSGAIAALAAPKYQERLHTFSVGYPGYPSYDERKQAEQLARTLKLPFHDVELRTEELVSFFPDLVTSTDDPIADVAAYGHYAVMRLAADHGLKVMLSGTGGDELFWGYPWVTKAVELSEKKFSTQHAFGLPHAVWRWLEQHSHNIWYQRLMQSSKVPACCRTLFQKGFELSRISPLHPEQLVFYDLVSDFNNAESASANLYTQHFAEQLPERNSWKYFKFDRDLASDIPMQICRRLFDIWLTSNCLALGDRVSMASSVEARLPLLDYRLIETVIGLRKAAPDHQLGHKFRLRSTLATMLPPEMLQRPKRGFEPPIQEWLTAINMRYLGMLQKGYLQDMDMFSSNFLQHIITEFKSRGRYLFLLYKLLVLEIWHRRVVLQERLPANII